MAHSFWTQNPDDTFSCIRCGASSFAPGGADEDLPTSCNCPAGELAAALDPRKSVAQATGPSAGHSTVTEVVTLQECLRRSDELWREHEALRKAGARLRVDGVNAIKSFEGGREEWLYLRESLNFAKEVLSLQNKMHEAANKILGRMSEEARDIARRAELKYKEQLLAIGIALQQNDTEKAASLMAEISAN